MKKKLKLKKKHILVLEENVTSKIKGGKYKTGEGGDGGRNSRVC